MRFLTPAVAAVALLTAQAVPALAQTTPPPVAPTTAPPAAAAPGTSVPETTAPAAPSTTAPAAPSPDMAPPAAKPHKAHAHGRRMSMHQRFAGANSAQDGHLTLDQARAAHWSYAIRHFDAIDTGHKGYITEADIHAYSHARYLARHASPATPAPAAPAPAAPPPTPAQ